MQILYEMIICDEWDFEKLRFEILWFGVMISLGWLDNDCDVKLLSIEVK
jgi:hypothetical protein